MEAQTNKFFFLDVIVICLCLSSLKVHYNIFILSNLQTFLIYFLRYSISQQLT